MMIPPKRAEQLLQEQDPKRTNRQKLVIPIQGNDIDKTIYENYQPVKRTKTREDIDFIIYCLKKHFVFYSLGQQELMMLAQQFQYCQIGQEKYLFEQNSPASSFFIIQQGSIQVVINKQIRRVLERGEGFGELALLYNAPRSASCKSVDKTCEMWVIDRVTFKKVVEEVVQQQMNENKKFIEHVALFQQLTPAQRNAISGVVMPQKFIKGQPVVSEGDDATSFYIVKEGSVSVCKNEQEVRKLYQFESFGEQALLQMKSVRQMTIKAAEDSILLALGKEIIFQILGDQVQQIIYRNIAKWSLERSETFGRLTLLQIEKMLDIMQKRHFSTGEVIHKPEQPIDRDIYIVLDGSIKQEEVIFNKGQIINDKYFKLKEGGQKVDKVSLIMVTNGTIGMIDYQLVQKFLGGTIEQLIAKNKDSEVKNIELSNQKKLEAMNIHFEDLIFIKKLGFGQFGSVLLVKSVKTKECYALKIINKKNAQFHSLETHVIQERQVLEFVNFQFLMKYYRSFKDDTNVYFLLEFIRGIELFDAMRDIGLLSTQDSQFFVGSLILVLDYLHSQNIIYRDIKPENLMVDDKGYLKLIDMGTAKIMKNQNGVIARTFSIIGTPHYMAPEVISGKGYNHLVDLWSVGICLYEFMCGFVPFGEEAEDPFDIYEDIVKKNITYPEYLKDKRSKLLMEQLLSKIPEIRLGGGYNQLKQNQWFKHFDWDKLYDMKLPPPFIPDAAKLVSAKEIKQLEELQMSLKLEVEKETKQMEKQLQNLKPQTKKTNQPFNWDEKF